MLAAGLAGVVVGYPEQEPIPGVQILAMDPRGRSVEAFTDAAGGFDLEVGAGLFRVRARPDQDTDRIGAYWGDSFNFCPATSIELGPTDTFDGVVVQLPVGGAVEGTVVDELGLPLAGAVVTATGLDFFNSSAVRSALTDDEGRFRVVGLDSVLVDGQPLPGRYRLAVRSEGVATWLHPTTWDPAASEPVEALRGETAGIGTLTRPAPVAVSGRLLGPDGQGVALAQVSVLAGLGGTLTGGSTDPDGRFSFPALWGDDLDLAASAPGYASVTFVQGLHLQPGESVELDPATLQPEATLSGAVVGLDEEGGALSLEDGLGTSAGRIALAPGAENYLLDGLPAGTWTLRFAPSPTSELQELIVPGVTLSPGQASSLDLELVAGAVLSGRSRRRGGEPLAGIEVVAIDPSTGSELSRGQASSDAEGAFILRGLPPGEALVRLTWRPFCSTDPTWVQTWAHDSRHEGEAHVVALEAGATVELEELLLPPDRDSDGMDDIWELAWGLDRGRADGVADRDGDGRSNLQEYLDRTDPRDADRAAGCSATGSAGGAGSAALACLLLAVRLTRRRAGVTIPAL